MARSAARELVDWATQGKAAMHVTAALVADYLRQHPIGVGAARPAPEFLIVDDRGMVYTRWPNGSVRWEDVASLRMRGLIVPPLGLLQHPQ